MKKAAFLFFRVEVGNAACAVQYLVVVQTMLVRCPKNLDFTVFQKVSLSNLIFIAAGKIFHFGTLSMTNEPVRSATKHAIAVAKENGALISFDPNIREPLWKDMEEAKEQTAYGLSVCDILKISDNEIQWFSGKEDYTEGIRMLQQTYQIPLILLSMGRDGSRVYYKNMIVEVPAFLQKNTIETTGAGDTFGACCLHYILQYGLMELTEQQLKDMLTFANAAASIITTRKGALRVMPSLEEIQNYFESIS